MQDDPPYMRLRCDIALVHFNIGICRDVYRFPTTDIAAAEPHPASE
jgi:hypothetical protein